MTTIVALGDSITYGYPYGRSWTGIVAERLDLPILNRGLNGDTLEGMLMRLETDVVPHGPGVCLVMGGTNDVFTGFDPESLQETIQQMDEALRLHGFQPVYGIPVPILLENVEATLATFRSWLSDWADTTIPFFDAFLGPGGRVMAERLPDGVHPDDEGYRLMANQAEPILRGLIA